MDSRSKWDDLDYVEDLSEIEDYLESMLLPVEPRPQYIDELRLRLIQPTGIDLSERVSPEMLRKLAFTGAGIASGVLVLLTAVRAVVALLGALGYLRILKEKDAAPATPA